MARELRSRKKVTETENGSGVATTVIEKTTVTSKRKATDDNSPTSRKIPKSTKKSIATNEDKDTPKKTTSKITKKSEPAAEELELSSNSEAEEEDDEALLTLAKDHDPEDEGAVDDKALFKAGQDVGKIPEVSDSLKSGKKTTEEPGVIYIGRIPHGFYEHEMRQYLSQFGPINRLRLSRNKKTGASKHFAFVEFEEASTAEIVAKTMNNYLLFGHILKCSTVPKEQVHEDLFKGANQRFKKVPWNKMAGKRLEKGRTQADWNQRASLEKEKREKKAAKLKALGYNFEAPDLKDVPPPPVAEVEELEIKAIEAPKDAEEDVQETVADEISSAKRTSVKAAKQTISASKVTTGKAKKTKRAKA